MQPLQKYILLRFRTRAPIPAGVAWQYRILTSARRQILVTHASFRVILPEELVNVVDHTDLASRYSYDQTATPPRDSGAGAGPRCFKGCSLHLGQCNALG
jgi:hypothetical protein